jgi:hypothetical protein
LEDEVYAAGGRATKLVAYGTGQQQEGEVLEKVQRIVQERKALPKKSTGTQNARATAETSKDDNFRFEAGGTGTVPTGLMLNQSNGTSLTIRLKRKFGTGEDMDKFERARASSPEGQVKDVDHERKTENDRLLLIGEAAAPLGVQP